MFGRARGIVALFAAGIAVAGIACGGGTSEPNGNNGNSTSPAAVAIVSGNGQTGLVGQPLSLPLSVKVTTSNGAAVVGASVTFAVTSGAASVSPVTATTDATGVAKTVATMKATPPARLR